MPQTHNLRMKEDKKVRVKSNDETANSRRNKKLFKRSK